jgi:zinc transporter
LAPTSENLAPDYTWGALGDLAPGLIWGYHIDAARCVEVHLQTPLDKLTIDGPDSCLWLHFDLVDQRTATTLQSLLPAAGFTLLASVVQTFLRASAAPELHFTQGVVHGALLDRVIDMDGVREEQSLLNIVCMRRLLLTGRRMHLRSVSTLRTQAREGQLRGTPSSLLDQLGRLTADEHARELEHEDHLLDQYEDVVLTESRGVERGHIIHMRHRLVRVHRELASLLRLYDRADREIRIESPRAAGAGGEAGAGYASDWIDFGSLVQYLQDLDGHCLALHDRARLLQDEVSAQLTVQTNRQLYVLSILTAVLGPPTIVVGMFGMNTGGLPLTERASGFLIALVLCALSSLLVVGVMISAGVIAWPAWWRRRRRSARRTRPSDDGAGGPRHGDESGPWGHLVDPVAGRVHDH